MLRAAIILAMLAVTFALAACGASGPKVAADTNARALAFAQCMRADGITEFPDPAPGGQFTVAPGSGIDPISPQFQAAASKCRKRTGFGGRASSPRQNELFEKLLRFSQCMRAHGISGFPDPERAPGGGIIRRPPQGISPDSPQFAAAKRACDGLLPNHGRGPRAGG